LWWATSRTKDFGDSGGKPVVGAVTGIFYQDPPTVPKEFMVEVDRRLVGQA
jgi:hypothetical protein